MMADNQLGDDDIFVYTGGEQRVPRDVKRVRIAENVDTISAGLFQWCQQLIEVEGHKKMKKIERYAFNYCRRLRKVTKMTGLIEIEQEAFSGCYALSDIDFGKVQIIGVAAFIECNSLTSVNMPSVRILRPGAFNVCKNLTGAVFGQDLERIEINTFFGCIALRSIVIPLKDNLIIANHAFNCCGNISRIDVLDGGIRKTISSCTWRAGEMKWKKKSVTSTKLFRISKQLKKLKQSNSGLQAFSVEWNITKVNTTC